MSDQRWTRLKVLFNGALDRPAEQREQWLREAAAGDLDLLHEAQALVDAHRTAGGFLEQPVEFIPDDVAALAPGAIVGPYAILEELGRGGMGVVYLAEDQRLGRRVALKALPASAAGEPGFRERLRREARAAATVSHPAVATVFALEEIGDQLFIASEYVPGHTLRAEIDRGPLADERARTIATGIAHALAAAHDAGVIHRDLKPENVLITASGVKVVDFGIAHVEGAEATRLTREGALIGTPAYMAPEQLIGAVVDARADLYSLGVVMREMVNSTTTSLAPIIARCLQAEPSRRFASAGELLRALETSASRRKPQETPQFYDTSRQKPQEAPQSHETPQPHDTSQPYETRQSRETDVASGFSRKNRRWWWEFHQAMAALTYWAMVVPAWTARGLIGGVAGRVFFIALLAAVIVAANLRLHLWFTSRFYPGELKWLRARVGRWVNGADWLFCVALIGGALLLGDERSPLAIVLLSFGIGAGVAFLVIEPATTRAAFRVK